MALAIDSQEVSGAGHNSATSPLTYTFTNTAGTLLVVGVVISESPGAANAPTSVGVTYNGVSMTQVGHVSWFDNTSSNGYLFYLVNPATGANSVVVTPVGFVSLSQIIASAISFTGQRASSPLGTATTANNGGTSSTPATVTLTGTTSGSYVVSVAGAGDAFTASPAVSPTVLSALKNVDGNTASDNLVFGYNSNTGGSVTAAYNITVNDTWGIAAVEIFGPPAYFGYVPPQVIRCPTSWPYASVSSRSPHGFIPGSCTWSPSDIAPNIALSNGNDTGTAGAGTAGDESGRATVWASTGKYYYEAKATVVGNTAIAPLMGFADSTYVVAGHVPGSSGSSVGVNDVHGTYTGGVQLNDGSWVVNDLLSLAIDLDNRLFWWRKNGGAWLPSGDPAAGTGGASVAAMSTPIAACFSFTEAGDSLTAFFTAPSWTHAAPAGYGEFAAGIGFSPATYQGFVPAQVPQPAGSPFPHASFRQVPPSVWPTVIPGWVMPQHPWQLPQPSGPRLHVGDIMVQAPPSVWPTVTVASPTYFGFVQVQVPQVPTPFPRAPFAPTPRSVWPFSVPDWVMPQHPWQLLQPPRPRLNVGDIMAQVPPSVWAGSTDPWVTPQHPWQLPQPPREVLSPAALYQPPMFPWASPIPYTPPPLPTPWFAPPYPSWIVNSAMQVATFPNFVPPVSAASYVVPGPGPYDSSGFFPPPRPWDTAQLRPRDPVYSIFAQVPPALRTPFKGTPSVVEYLGDEREHRALIARTANLALGGKINATTSVTLNPSATTTTLSDPRISADSTVHLMPQTSAAATAFAAGIYVTGFTTGSCVLNHASNASTNQNFSVLIIGTAVQALPVAGAGGPVRPSPAFYVSPTGNDTNPGTPTAPFLTLEHAQTVMRGSTTKTTVLMAGSGGSYNRTAALVLSSADNGTTWQYDPVSGVNTAVLDGGNTVANIIQWDADNVVVDGIKMQHTTNNIVFHDNGTTNILNPIIRNCDIGFNTATATFQASGILFNGVNGGSINNNYVHDTQAEGITLNAYQTGLIVDNIVVDSNVVLRTGTGISDCGAIYIENPNTTNAGGSKASIYTSASIKFTNNYVRDYGAGQADAHGIYLDYGANHVTVSGNVVGPPSPTSTASSGFMLADGFNNSFSGNIIDLGATGHMLTGVWFYFGTVGFTITGNSFTGNIAISNFAGSTTTSAFGTSGTAYVQTNGGGTHTITNNVYHNYGGGAEVSTGNLDSDSSPVREDPLISGWNYAVASNSPVFNSPVNFPAIKGNWGPPGFVLPQTGTVPSCPH